eukprot:TRINITY_DN7426_c0_g1_i1.p1 TRINITY_DN7426_c0_g1~~TRINITY_DN7426_c0_g1_i1.p1  ORF type:complete len:1518 (+),score=255.28 TRINITY_DN7426_c0_g1_i1:646-4554(+)
MGAEPSKLVGVDSISGKTFLFELIEDILVNFSSFLTEIPDFFKLLRARICPLIVHVIRNKKEFPSLVRVMRICVRLTVYFPEILVEEAQTIITRLVLLLEGDYNNWVKALVLEVLFSLAKCPDLLMKLYLKYDKDADVPMIDRILRGIGRFVQSSYKKSIVLEMMPYPNESKDLCMDMLNSEIAVEPSEAYIVCLGIRTLSEIVDSIYSLSVKYKDQVITNASGEKDKANVVEQGEKTKEDITLEEDGYNSCRQLADNAWPSLLVLSFVLGKARHEGVIQLVLKTYQSFTEACGILKLLTAQDALLTTLHKFSLPHFKKTSATVAGIPLLNKSNQATISGNGASNPVSLLVSSGNNTVVTKKNVLAMKRVLTIAHQLGNNLSESWAIVLDTLDVIHTTLVDTSSVVVDNDLSDTPVSSSKDELQVLDSAMTSIFSTSMYFDDTGIVFLLKELEKQSRSRLFPEQKESRDYVAVASEHHCTLYFAFGIQKMIELAQVNLHRLHLLWEEITNYITDVSVHPNEHVRTLCVSALASFAEYALKQAPGKIEGGIDVQLWVLQTLSRLSQSENSSVRSITLKQVHSIIQQCGHNITITGWPFLLDIIRRTIDSDMEPNPKHVANAFQSLQYICTDFTGQLNGTLLENLITTIGAYGKPVGDINIAITSPRLLWSLSDHISLEDTKKSLGPEQISTLWILLFKQLHKVSVSTRNEIRTAALRSMFGILTTHGRHLRPQDWKETLEILYEILDGISALAGQASHHEGLAEHQLGLEDGRSVMMLVHHSRNTEAKQWNETRVIALEGVLRIFKTFFTTLQQNLEDVSACWRKLMLYIVLYWDNSDIEIALAGVKAVESILVAASNNSDYPKELWDQGWQTYRMMVTTLTSKESVVSHNTINTFTASIQNLHGKLKDKFSEEDASLFLEVIRPLPLLPVEYAGELGPLQRAVTLLFNDLTSTFPSRVPQTIGILLSYISQAIKFPFSERVSSGQKWVVPTSLDKVHLSLAEKSLASLEVLWRLPTLTPELKVSIVQDLLQVLGKCIQLKHTHYSSPLWHKSLVLFLDILSNGLGYLEMATQTAGEDKDVWSDLTDDIEGFLISPASTNPTPTTPEEEKRNEEWDLSLCNLLTNLLYHSSSSDKKEKEEGRKGQPIQERLIELLFLWAKSTKKWSSAGRKKTAEEYTFQMYQLLFALCSGKYKEDDEAMSKSLSVTTTPIMISHCAHLLSNFAKECQQETQDDTETNQEVVMIIKGLRELNIPEEVKLGKGGKNGHLFLLFPVLCDCVVTRDLRVRQELKETLKLIAAEYAK